MPLFLLGALVGGAGVFVVTDAADAAGRLVKWGALGAAGYLAWQHLK